MRQLAFVVLVVSSSCSLFKPHHVALEPSGHEVPMKTIIYPTGLRVVAEQHVGSKRVAVAILVGTGAADDLPGLEGTAHFVEHLAFRSKPGNRLAMWDELDFAGVAGWNAETRLDSTLYSGVVAADRTRDVMPLLASLVVRPLNGVDGATFEVERSVLRNEHLVRFGHGGGAYLAKLGELAYGKDSKPGRPISGDPKSLAAITPADVEAFVKTNYRPQAVTVVLVGDVNLEQLDAMVRESFPPAWLDSTERVLPFVRAKAQGAAPTQMGDRPLLEVAVSRRLLVFVWQVPGPDSNVHNAMPLVAHALARRVARQIDRRVSGSYIPGLLGSMLTLTVIPQEGEDLDALSKKVRGVKDLNWVIDPAVDSANGLRRFAAEQNPLTHAESRARQLWMALRGRTTTELTTEGWDELARLRADVLVMRNARELLVVPRLVGTENVPLPPAPSAAVKNVVVEPERLAAVAMPTPLPDAQSYVLPNGLRVVLSRRLPLPMVSVTLALPIGTRHTSRLTSALVGATLDWNDQRRFDFLLAGRPSARVTPDATLFTLTGQSFRLPVMLDVFGHNLGPYVRPSYVDRLDALVGTARKIGQRLERQLDEEGGGDDDDDEVRPLPAQVLPPDASSVALRFDEMKALSRSDFVKFIDAGFHARGAVLFVDGDFEVESTRRIIAELFSGWPAGDGTLPPLRATGAAPPKQKEPRVVDVQDAMQTTVTVMCRLPPATSVEARGGNALLASALELSFEADLRQARGLTYGVTTALTSWGNDDNLLLLRTTLDARERQQGLRQFLEKLDSLDGAVWEQQVVDLARWRLAKQRLASTLTSSSVSATLAAEMVRGASLEEAAATPRRLATVPLKYVDEAWDTCSQSLALEVFGQKSTIDMVLKARAKK